VIDPTGRASSRPRPAAKNSVLVSGGIGDIAKTDAPQPVDLDRRVVGALQNAMLLPAVFGGPT
jgi:hypothetical protein